VNVMIEYSGLGINIGWTNGRLGHRVLLEEGYSGRLITTSYTEFEVTL